MILFLLKALSRFFCALPVSTALTLGRGLGFIFGRVFRYHYRDAVDNATRCLPDKSPTEIKHIVNQMYSNFGMNAVEALRISKFTKEFRDQYISVTGIENYRAVEDSGRGCVALMAHLGNWEIQGFLALLFDLKLNVIVKSLKPAALNDYVVKSREETGLRVLNRKNAVRPALRCLENKEVVSCILDQNVTRYDGVFVDFFGQPACTSTGLAFLAIKTDSPVLPTFTLRRPNGHHEIFILPAIEPPSELTDENIHALTQQCTSLIEDLIKQYPEQWIWLHRRWRTQPMDGELSSMQN